MKKICLTWIVNSVIIGFFLLSHTPVWAQNPPSWNWPSIGAIDTSIDTSIITQIQAMHTALKIPDTWLWALNGNGPKVGDGCWSIIIARNNDVRTNKTNPHAQKSAYENCLNELIARLGQTDDKGQTITCWRAQQFLPLQKSSSPNQKPLCCINGTIVWANWQPLPPAGETWDLPQGRCLATSTQDPCLAISNLLWSLHKAASTLVCGIPKSFLNQESAQKNADANQKKKFTDLVTNGNTFVTAQATHIQEQLTALNSLEEFTQCTWAESQKNTIESLLKKLPSVRTLLSSSDFSWWNKAYATTCQNIPAPFSLSLNNCIQEEDKPWDIILLFNAVTNVRQGLTSDAFVLWSPLRILKTPLPNPNNFVSILKWSRQDMYKQAQEDVIKTPQNTLVPITQAAKIINTIEQDIRSYPSNLRRFLELWADIHKAYCDAQLQYSVEGSEWFTKGGWSCRDAIGQYFAKTSTVDETIDYRQKNLDDVKARLANTAATYVSRNQKKDITIPEITTCTMEELEKHFWWKDKVTASIKAELAGLIQECQMYETLIKIAKEKQTAATQKSSNQTPWTQSPSQTTETQTSPQTSQTQQTNSQQTGQTPQQKTDTELLREVEDQMIQRCQEQSCTEITPLGMCCTEGQRWANNGICYPSALIAPNGEFCAAGVTKEGTCVANHWWDMGIQCSPQQLLIGACSFKAYDALQIRASNKDPSPKVFIQDIILSLTSFIGVVATLSLMRSWFKAVMSWYDNWSEYQTAIRNAWYSIIWLLLAAFSYAIVRLIQYVAMAWW